MNLDRNYLPRKSDLFIQIILFFIFTIVLFLCATQELWSGSILMLLAGVTLLVASVSSAKDREILINHIEIHVLFLIFFLFVLMTLIPIPKCILRIVSNNTYLLYSRYLPYYESCNSFGGFRCASIYPYGTLFGMSLMYSYFVSFSILVNRFNQIKFKLIFFKILIFCGGLVSILGILNIYFQNGKLLWFREIVSGTPTGPFINTIHFSAFMSLCIPVTFGFWLGKIKIRLDRIKYAPRKTEKFFIEETIRFLIDFLIYLIPALLMIFGLFKALGRGGMLAFALSMILFTILLIIKKETRKISLILMVTGVLAVFLVLYVDFVTQGSIKERIMTLKNPLTTLSAQMRFSVWSDTFKIFLDFPFIGTGLNTFYKVFPIYKTIHGSGKSVFLHAENDYVELLSDIGVVGIVILLVLAIIIIKKIFLNFKLVKDPFMILVFSGAISSMFAFCICASTDFVSHLPIFMLFMTVLCFVSSYSNEGSEITANMDKRKAMYSFVISISFFTAIFLILFSFCVLAGQIFIYKANKSTRSFQTNVRYLTWASTMDGLNSDYHFRLGRVYFDKAVEMENLHDASADEYFKNADLELENAIKIMPLDWRYYFYLGSVRLILSHESKIQSYIENAQLVMVKSVELNPTQYELYENLAEYYLAQEPKKAMLYYRSYFELRPYDFENRLEYIYTRIRDVSLIRIAIPDDYRMLFRYACFLNSKGIDADIYYQKVMEVGYNLKSVQKLELAELFASVSRYKQGIVLLKDFIEKSDLFKLNKYNFSIEKYEDGKIADECKTISALGDSYKSQDVLYKLGVYYFNLGNYKKTIEYFNELSLKNPYNTCLQFKMAVVYYCSGDYMNSYKFFKNVAEDIMNKS